jgi:hypothetical protein
MTPLKDALAPALAAAEAAAAARARLPGRVQAVLDAAGIRARIDVLHPSGACAVELPRTIGLDEYGRFLALCRQHGLVMTRFPVDRRLFQFDPE